MDDRTDKPRRVSITKLQRESAVGAELIALTQSITQDGKLTPEEVADLRAWVDANRGANLPAQEFLLSTVATILADGVVTNEELDELYRAIEKVLPPDIRASVKGTRVTREALEREEAERWGPIESLDFCVKGVPYEGRLEIVKQHARAGDPAYLIRDRRNAYSDNAIEVRLANGMQVGFVPEQLARHTARSLDRGLPHVAYIKDLWQGSLGLFPIVVADIFPEDSPRNDLVFEKDVPSPPRPARPPSQEGSASPTVPVTRPATIQPRSPLSQSRQSTTPKSRWLLPVCVLIAIAFIVTVCFRMMS